jgi:hypothetical protein
LRSRGAALAAGVLLAALAALLMAPTPAGATAPPVVSILAPFNASFFDANATVLFSANNTFDPDANSTLEFIWSFPTEVIQGTDLRYLYYTNFTAAGTYTVSLTVRDNESLEGYANVTVTIRPQNAPPVAVIAGPAEGTRFFTNEFIDFSGTGSLDPEGSPLSFFWSTNRSGQFGTGENLSVRLPEGAHTITLTVVDNRTGANSTSLHLSVVVNTPPRVSGQGVTPDPGNDSDTFTFQATYFDDNGESAASVLLILDGSPHAMQFASGSDPAAGQTYVASLTLAAGRHSFYIVTSDGNLTNISSTVSGPEVWQQIQIIAPGGLARLEARVLPPYNLSLVPWLGPVPVDPSDMLAVSPAYRVEGTFLPASNFSLRIAFNPPAGANRSSALLFRAAPSDSSWVALVTQVDGAANTATSGAPSPDVPEIYRVYARRVAAPANQPPHLAISARGDPLPNRTVEFDASGSSDPENATLLFWWRVEGPGLTVEWVPGAKVAVAFPTSGTYNLTLRADDGSGNVAFKSLNVDVREPSTPPLPGSQEGAALAALAIAVIVSAVLALWWRSRVPPRKKMYEDYYGRAYKQSLTDEREYAQLFEKFAEAPAGPDEAGAVAGESESE